MCWSILRFYTLSSLYSIFTCQNVADHYHMESFLSRVTGKTFPRVYWSPFDEFLHFLFKYVAKLFEYVNLKNFFHFLIQNCQQIVWIRQFDEIFINLTIAHDTRRPMERFFMLSDPTYKPLWNGFCAVFWRSVWGRYGLNWSLVYPDSYNIWSVWVFWCFLEVGMRSVWLELIPSVS